MENQDKLYQQFKDAAEKAEGKGFDHMEAVWNRVEEKLDEKKKRRVVPIWQYASVAAILLICLTVGGYLITNDSDSVIPSKAMPEYEVSTVIDTQKVEEVLKPDEVNTNEKVVVNKTVKTLYNSRVSKKTAASSTSNETESKNENTQPEKVDDATKPSLHDQYISSAIFSDTLEKKNGDIDFVMLHNKDMKTIGQGTIEQSPRASFVQNMEGQFPGVKVETGKPAGHTTKIMIGGNPKGLVEPLYVIDGMIASYEIFKQLDPKKIESISLLKDEGARAIYSDRGRNGVIIITTKNLSRKEKRQLKKLIKEHAEKSASSGKAFQEFQKNKD